MWYFPGSKYNVRWWIAAVYCYRKEDNRLISFTNNSIYIRQAVKNGYIEMPCEKKMVADLSFPTSQLRRGRVQDSGRVCPTITTTGGLYVFEKL